MVVGGDTSSTNLPGTPGGAQPGSDGSGDGFVARLSGDLKAASAQTISFPAQNPASHPFVAGGTFPINPLATASSGLPVHYGSAAPDICSVSGSTVTAGRLRVRVLEPANATITLRNWNAVNASEFSKGWRIDIGGGTTTYLVELSEVL